MDVKILDQRHPSYQADLWARYDALYRGGEAFRACLTHFLPKNAAEPHEVYEARTKEAYYTGYVGPIVDWFSAKLCSGALVVRATTKLADDAEPPSTTESADVDAWYGHWKEDVDGLGTDLIDFVRTRFAAACVKGRSWWCVEKPTVDGTEPANRDQWEKLGLGNCTVFPIENEQVLDWEVDERGQFVWVCIHTIETRRETIADTRGRIVETWTVYDRESVERFELSYDPDAGQVRPETATSTGRKPHGFSRVPIVRLGFTGTRGVKVKIGTRMLTLSGAALEGFWLLNRLADPQIAHFRNSAALDWNIKRTCYAMPVFQLEDRDKPPVMGAGYYIMIGTQERASWIGPPTEHLAVLSERCDRLQQEIYRVANQLAQGVDNNAAALGRSGLSKVADASSTEVVLRVYGSLVREAVEQTYELLAEGRGDKLTWSIEGFDTFTVLDAAGVIESATQAQALGLHSVTARRLIELRVIDALLPGASQVDKDKIEEEVEAGISAEETLNLRMHEQMAEPGEGTDTEEADEPPTSTPERAPAKPGAKQPPKPGKAA